MNQISIRNAVLAYLASQGSKFVPVGISARHVHLSQKDAATLFGPGYTLRLHKELSQPGQFAAKEKVTVIGPRGEIAGVRVLGPERGETQVEMTFSDLMRLGISGVVRMSGRLEDTPGCILQGPAGQITIPRGVIVAQRHLHLSPSQAALYGLKNGDAVTLRATGPRPGTLEEVICRVGDDHELEVHLDTDEANALCLTDGALLEVITPGEKQERCSCSCGKDSNSHGGHHCQKSEEPASLLSETEEVLDLVTERDIEDAWRRGINVIRCLPRCIITDAARERAASLELTFKRCKE